MPLAGRQENGTSLHSDASDHRAPANALGSAPDPQPNAQSLIDGIAVYRLLRLGRKAGEGRFGVTFRPFPLLAEGANFVVVSTPACKPLLGACA